MLNFLFWNLRGKNLSQSIGQLAIDHEIDILVFAECEDIASILLALNPIGKSAEYFNTTNLNFVPVTGRRLEIFTRFPPDFQESIEENYRYFIRYFHLPGKDPFILVAAHLLSLLNDERGLDRYNSAVKLASAIQLAEGKRQLDKTVLVGDLNLNPFDDGMVSSSALHGVMTKQIAKKRTRTVQGVSSPFFYNPMWSKMGDYKDRPAGTYFYWKSASDCKFWYVFDQVLIRPSLIDQWDDDHLHILTGLRKGSLFSDDSFLTDSRIPDKRNMSDHLPIIFKLNL